MDEFDEAILATLIDGKPYSFNQLLNKIDFSHNTLRLHLDKLVDPTIVRGKRACGREADLYLLIEFRRPQSSLDDSIWC